MLCQNVGTCVAIHDAVLLGKPLISRITTLTGEALARPMNVEALIGTPTGELLAFAGLEQNRLNRLIGADDGLYPAVLDVPVIKTTNACSPARSKSCLRRHQRCLHPLRRVRRGLSGEPAAAAVAFLCTGPGARAAQGPPSVRLHRVWCLRLRLPVEHPAGAVLPRRQGRDPRAGAEAAEGRAFQAALRTAPERLRRAEEQKEAERKARAERAARAKAAQGESAQVVSDTTAATPSAAPKSGLSETQKKLKIEASMAQVALKKAEKQLAAHDTPELQAQVADLRKAAEAAQQALDAVMQEVPAQHLPSAQRMTRR